MTYLYNGLGQMIEKFSGVSAATILMHDKTGHVLGEYTGAGAMIQETVWLGDLPVATLRPNGSGGVSVYYIHADQLNAPRTITRPLDNATMWRWDADPFGTVAANPNPQGQGAFIYNLRFPGQYYQAETGLNYNYHRDYDSGVGRYTQSDPIGLRGGLNSFAYVVANPLRYADKLGLVLPRERPPGLPRCVRWPDFPDPCASDCFAQCGVKQGEFRRSCINDCKPWWQIIVPIQAGIIGVCNEVAGTWTNDCVEHCTGPCLPPLACTGRTGGDA